LFNSRRGGEPARLLLQEWLDADNNVWVSPEMIEKVSDPLEKFLAGSYKLACQRGKGSRKMVPILMPNDCLEPLRKLVKIRADCNIDENNPYLFATVKSPDGWAHGWQSIFQTCQKAAVSKPENLTATKMRHRASTAFGLLDVPKKERKAWFDHLGHSKEMNETVYQCPPSLMELTKVGRYLKNLDNGDLTTSSVSGSVKFRIISSQFS